MEQLSGRQYGEWLKAGGVIKNGGEKDKMKVQSEAEKGSLPSTMVDGRVGDENGTIRGNSPALVVDGGAVEVGGTTVMMDATPLDLVEGAITSSNREQGRLIIWEDRVPEVSKMGLERTARDEQKGARTGMVRNELQGNEAGQEIGDKMCGPVIKEAEMLSLIRPKEKGGISEERKCGPVLREADVLSLLRLKEKGKHIDQQTSVSSSLIPTIAILSSKRTEAPKNAFLVGNSHKTTRLATTQPPASTSRLRSSKKDYNDFHSPVGV
nr:hypothetical protein CFP56_08197 [Quercus suber]